MRQMVSLDATGPEHKGSALGVMLTSGIYVAMPGMPRAIITEMSFYFRKSVDFSWVTYTPPANP